VKVYVVVHDVHSIQRLTDIARLALNCKCLDILLVISKATGPAATEGVAEVHKLAYKLNKSILVTTDLRDAVNILTPKNVYLVTSHYEGECVTLNEFLNRDLNESMIVFSGQDVGFRRAELALGEVVSLGLDEFKALPPLSIATIVFYELCRRFKEKP